jgi:hypothetical protein
MHPDYHFNHTSEIFLAISVLRDGESKPFATGDVKGATRHWGRNLEKMMRGR